MRSSNGLPCYSLRVVFGPACVDQPAYALRTDRLLTIGRDQDEPNLRIEDVALSRHHATIYWDRDIQSFKIIDEGSHNGVYVNGTRITATPLQPNDVVRVGRSLLLLRAERVERESIANPKSRAAQSSLLALFGTLMRSREQHLTVDAAEALLLGEFHTSTEVTERVMHPRNPVELSVLDDVEPHLGYGLDDARSSQTLPKCGKHHRVRRWLEWIGVKVSDPR